MTRPHWVIGKKELDIASHLPPSPRGDRPYDPVHDGPRICNCRDCLVLLSSSPSDRERYGFEKLAGYIPERVDGRIVDVPYCAPCLQIRQRAAEPGPLAKRMK